MAFSTVFSLSCTPQTQNRLLSVQNSHSLFRTTSLLPPQATQKFFYQPLRYKRVSPIVANPRRSFGKVKALKRGEKSYENVEVFSKEYLALSLAHDVYQLSKIFIQERGFFTVVLPGGSSIKHLRKLVEPPYVDSIEWSKWHFFWVEERVLPKDHPDTNYRLAYELFLSKVPYFDMVNNVHSINGFELPAQEAAALFDMKLRLLGAKGNVMAASSTGFPKFDLMILNMGSHGHPHYLFPDDPRDLNDPRWITFTTNSATPPKARIALTLPVINSSSYIAMVVSGAAKAHAIYSVLEDHHKPKKLDVEMICPQGKMKWYLDEGAASKLTDEAGDHPFLGQP